MKASLRGPPSSVEGSPSRTLPAAPPPARGAETMGRASRPPSVRRRESGDAPSTPLAPPRDGELLQVDELLPIVERDRYIIDGVFAQGGVGRILRARDTRLHRSVALKELVDRAGGAAERFVRETLVTARLQHPAVIPIYDAGRWPSGELFYSMKLVSGRSLEVILMEARTLEQRLALLRHVLAAAEAVAYAHSRHIVHRDLKPANILVGSFGETLVIDWGLAKDLGEEVGYDVQPGAPGAAPTSGAPPSSSAPPSSRPSITVAGAVMGTPAYMPREQALGQPVDERADVYALGAILYEVLAGAMPYEGQDAEEMLLKVVTGPPIPLEQRQPGLPEDLLAIVKKAMTRRPEERYPTASELAEDLRRFETGQIVGAHRYSPAERFRRFVRRYRAPLLVAATAIVVIAALGALSVERVIAERDRAERQQAEATRRADDLTLMQARAALESDPTSALVWLKTLSPGSPGFRVARTLAADARAQGVSRPLRGHALGMSAIAFSPDGKRLVTASDDRTARLWDVATGESRVLARHDAEVWSGLFSPDGELVATRSLDGTVRLWDVATGDSRVLTQERRIAQIAFSPDGELLATLGEGGGVRLWDVATGAGRLVHAATERDLALAFADDGTFAFIAEGMPMLLDRASGRLLELPEQESPARGLAISSDGQRVATVGWDGSVRVWSGREGASRKLPGHTGEGRALAFSPDGRTLVSTGEDGVVRISDLTTGESRALRGHAGVIYGMKISPDGRQVATCGSDHTVRLWDVATGRSRVLRGFVDAVLSVAFSPDGGLVAAAGTEDTARIWDLRAGGDRVLSTSGVAVSAVAFSPDGSRAVTGGEDGVVRIAAVTGDRIVELRGHEGKVVDVRVAPDGVRAASAGQDGTVRVFRVDGAGRALVLRGHRGPVVGISISPDGRRIVSGGADGVVRLWDTSSGEARVLHEQGSPVTSIAVSRDWQSIGTGGADGVVRLWRRGVVRELLGHRGRVTAVAFSPDGVLLASGGEDHTIRLWAPTSDGRRTIDTGGEGPRGLAFSSGGHLLAASTNETMVRLWDPRTGEPRGLLRGHSGLVQGVAMSPGGERLAAAGSDGTVWLWDIASSAKRALAGHGGAVSQVAFSPDGRSLVSVGKDGTVRLWLDDLPRDEAGLRAWLDAAVP